LTGGFVAGAILTLALALAIRLTAREAPGPRASGADRWRAAWGAAPALGLGVVVVAGIRFGLVTTTEAAALAAGYTILASLKSKVGLVGLRTAFLDAGSNAAAIGLLIGAASPLAFLIAVDDIAALTTKAVEALGAGPVGTLLLANLILLVAGLALDTGVSILLLAPILVPIVAAAGIDPIHFGVILVVNQMIGGLTPPVGILVYVVGGVMRLPITAIFRAVLPFLAALLAALAVLCAAALLPVI
jgi:tripartite ATP-independent transporter DctM subunit